MPPRPSCDILPSEITPPEIYRERRRFMQGMGVLAASAALGGAPDAQAGTRLAGVRSSAYTLDDEKTPYKAVTTYNNFYEFGTDKSDPSDHAGSLKTRPWTVTVEGEASKPGVYDIDSLLKLAPLEERIYRMRCVEGWSMVIPWVGFPLSELIRRAAPTGKAKYVEFVSLNDPRQMPGQRSGVLDWPYVEGLRLDEAMHPLTILAVGLYGEVLPNQNGAPIRLVVPWKYGFGTLESILPRHHQSEWCADPAGGAVEVWIQECQVHRQDTFRRETAVDGVDARGAAGVWLLFQRESACRPSPLEPGEGTPYRRIPETRHADVQWLRRPGGATVSRHGSAEVFLMGAILRNPKCWLFAVCLLPLARLFVLGSGGGLGANPIEFITHSTGTWTLVGLLVTLSVTPLRRLTGRADLIRYRRMLGLFAFFYAILHFMTYLWLDQFFDFASIAKDIVKRPFITVGFAAFVLLIPLAVTSTRVMMRRLGRRWQPLHRLVYLIALLGVIHYVWLVKKDLTQPLMFGAVLVLLLAMRLPWSRNALHAVRNRLAVAR